MVKYKFVVVLLLLSSAVFGQYPVGSPVAINGKLKVSGLYLKNECGNPVQLRGMSTHGIQWFANCLNESSITALANDWEADVLRLAVYIQENGYVTNPTYYKTVIDNLVEICGRKGIYIILDFHVHRPGDPMSYITEAKEFWTYMATKHKDKKHLLYEICNEPNQVLWPRVKEYANIVIPLIRNIDPKTVILVGSTTYSQDVHIVAEDPLPYTNIMYTLHFYNYGETLRTKANKALARGLPIFISEFGTTNPQNTEGPFLDQMEVWNAWMNDHKLSWANWSFCDKDEPSAALKPGSCSGNWNNTTISGTWVKSKMKSPDNFVCNSADTTHKKSISQPFNNIASVVPGKIEAENYDLGDNGVGFRNYEKKYSLYRNDGPEVLQCVDGESGYAVAKIESGEWMNYTIDVKAEGKYDIQLRLLSKESGNMCYVEANGKNVSGPLTIPVTGPFYQTITIPSVNLPAGIQDLKFRSVTNNLLLNYINIVSAVSGPRAPVVNFRVPSVIYASPSEIAMSAFATDADGSISKVEFFNGITKIGEDLTSPYSFSWLNVNSGTYLLKAVATDNNGNQSESRKFFVNVIEPKVSDNVQKGLKAEYFNNKNLQEPSVLVRVDTTIDFKWGIGSPASLINTDNFSARWTGLIKPKYSELYTFNVTTDDGVRLYMDSIPLVLDWNPHSVATQTVSIPLSANAVYQLKMEYFDTYSSAEAKLTWSSPSQPLQVVPVSALLQKLPVNLPPSIVLTKPANESVVSSQSIISISATAFDKDGTVDKVVFYKDSEILKTFSSQPYSFDVSLPAGNYNLSAVATDNMGTETKTMNHLITVTQPDGLGGSGLKGEYFNNKQVFGTPVLIRKDVNVNFKWLTGSPDPKINTDVFSARWSGMIQASQSDTFKFYTTSDDGVRLYIDNSLVINDWNNHAAVTTTGKFYMEANKKYSIRVEYYDNYGGAEISLAWSATNLLKEPVPQANLFPPVDNLGVPTVSITLPVNNQSYTAPASVSISVKATDTDGTISKLEFFAGVTKIGESLVSPFNFIWSNVLAGTYSITAKAYDNGGNSAISEVVTVIITEKPSNLAPSINLTSPTEGSVFTQTSNITISADANDSDGTVSVVEFFSNNTKIGEDRSSPYTYSWSNPSQGNYTIQAKATDNAGASSLSNSVTIKVNPAVNQPPTAKITAPASGSAYTSPATINFTSEATDSDGSVTKVEYFSGSIKIGEAVSAPYQFAWSGVPKGTYMVSIMATDNLGSVVTSSSITLTVSDPVISNCTTEVVPAAGLWVVRNEWSDQLNSSGVSNTTTDLKATHRQWGQDRLYLIQTGKKLNLTSGIYNISFDFKNDPLKPVRDLQIGLSTGASSAGPVLSQPLITTPAGSSTGTFINKTISYTLNSSGDYMLTVGMIWPGQISLQSVNYIKNISVCKAVANSRTELFEETNSELAVNDVLKAEVLSNPTDKEFNVRLNKAGTVVQISATSVEGEVMLEGTRTFDAGGINFGSTWPAGLYFMKVIEGEKIIVIKLVKL